MAIPTLPQDTDAETLAQIIEQLVIAKRMSYLDAVIYYCAEKNIEPELIAGNLGDKIWAIGKARPNHWKGYFG